MTDHLTSPFLFVTCQVGAEPALKAEVQLNHPELRFAYSRPGFVTFKKTGGELNESFVLRSVFARAYGLSLGKGPAEKILEVAQKVHPHAQGKKLRLHCWERDLHVPGEEPLGYSPGIRANILEKDLLSQAPELFSSGLAEQGDWVLDCVITEESEVWVGCHLHVSPHSPWPGGKTKIDLPADSPSRAYLKLEEALLWSGSRVRPGDIAVEIGSAPGGASWALLNRGVKVVGIDPAEMAPQVLKHPHFRHFKQPVNSVLREDLPDSIQWLLLDMNVEPQITLFAVDRLASRMKDSLLGVFLTVKLNQWKLAGEIPMMLDHVKAMGMVRVKAGQLFHHRQEILIAGLTRQGLTRKGGVGKYAV